MYNYCPKVSIILPTYNGAKYLKQSIDSCLNQTYKNIELIVVNDCSTDETEEIIRSYDDNRMKYIRHDVNKGLPNALNTGFKIATGDYLTWTSDDNFYADIAIEKMLFFLIVNGYHFVYCDFFIIYEKEPSNLKIRKLPDKISFQKGNNLGACFLYSKLVMETIGEYDPETRLAEDYDYWIRVSKKFLLGHINEPLYYYRVHENSLYFSNYYEVKVTGLMVRLKNDVLDIDQITNLFITLIAQKNTKFSKISVFKKVNIKINKISIKKLFSMNISNILKQYKIRKISLNQAKKKLNKIIEATI